MGRMTKKDPKLVSEKANHSDETFSALPDALKKELGFPEGEAYVNAEVVSSNQRIVTIDDIEYIKLKGGSYPSDQFSNSSLSILNHTDKLELFCIAFLNRVGYRLTHSAVKKQIILDLSVSRAFDDILRLESDIRNNLGGEL